MRLVSMIVAGALFVGARAEAQIMLDQVPTARPREVAGEPSVKGYPGMRPDMLYEASLTSFRQAGIKPQISDASNYRLLYEVSPAGPKVGGLKIENVFDCGGEKDAPLAKTLELAVSVTSAIRPSADGSEMALSVTATPTAPADGGPAPVCRSKGALERKLTPVKIAFKVTRVGRD